MDSSSPRTKLKITCEYDGSGYSGWADAPTNPKPSVQSTIEACWRTLFPQTSQLIIKSSSRTDAGVHALGQVITIESDIQFGNVPVLSSEKRPSAAEKKKLKRAARGTKVDGKSHINSNPGTPEEVSLRLNSFLPPDIVLHSSQLVPLDFCAKEASLRRMYRYEILNHRIRSAIGRLYTWHVKDPLDIESMKQAAEMFIGVHDMSCFCPNFYMPEDKSKTLKTIEMVRFTPYSRDYYATFDSNTNFSISFTEPLTRFRGW